MIIAIDAGNTRIKWGVHDGSEWIAGDAVATIDVSQLAAAADTWPRRAAVAVCCVAGERTATVLAELLERRGFAPRWLRSGAAAGGVVNRYETPAQLGADRWAALLGARALVAGACVVVCAGTATTVDLLDAEGIFLGGAILPGFDLMRQSLQRNTAQLPLARGKLQPRPRNTDDAIVTGCLQAQAGAIERLRRQLPGAPLLVGGGAAPALLPLLDAPLRHEPRLILEGLRHFAAAPPG